jgi:hypothetical protein
MKVLEATELSWVEGGTVCQICYDAGYFYGAAWADFVNDFFITGPYRLWP